MITAIRPLAEGFRSAIERCPKETLPISFAAFPYGSCGDATLLLAKHLEHHGHTGFADILGMRVGRSHAWLSRDDLVSISPATSSMIRTALSSWTFL